MRPRNVEYALFCRGWYEPLGEDDYAFYFRLEADGLRGDFRLFQVSGDDFLLERIDEPAFDWLRDPVEPMSATSTTEIPDSGDFVYEVKWDGVRVWVTVDEGYVRIRTGRHTDVTRQFPELVEAADFYTRSALFDAEIVCFDLDGRPDFSAAMRRVHAQGQGGINQGVYAAPATCYLFDCLYLDGRAIVNEPLSRRQAWMAASLRRERSYQISHDFSDGRALWLAVRDMGLDGILAKERSSRYRPGERSRQWLTIETQNKMRCVVVGYTRAKRAGGSSLDGLHVASFNGRDFEYRGLVREGISGQIRGELLARLSGVRRTTQPAIGGVATGSEADTIWLEPELVCEVGFDEKGQHGLLKRPVFLRIRPDCSNPRAALA